jgi:hypothetical protein
MGRILKSGPIHVSARILAIDQYWFADQAKWEGLHSLGVPESVRQVGTEEPTVERRYCLSSLPVDVEKFARAVRGHWGMENSLLWCLDAQMGEDQSHARTGHVAKKPGHAPPLGAQTSKTGQNQAARSQWQTT